MLQACYQRIVRRWPNAVVHVVCYRPEALEELCPGAIPLGPPFRDAPVVRHMNRRVRLGSEQILKTFLPLVPLSPPSRQSDDETPSLRAAVAAADGVIASGGGYLCDKFWWHGLGVLAALRAAQRWRIPTAAVGQGIGPLRRGPLRSIMGRIMRDLDVLTLRETRTGGPLLAEMGLIDPEVIPSPDRPSVTSSTGRLIELTGDDALSLGLAITPKPESERTSLGFNVRVGADSELSDTHGLGEAAVAAAAGHGVGIITLPVSNYAVQDDHSHSTELLAQVAADAGVLVVSERIELPVALAEAASRCAVVVSGSYHGALFALAQGCPVVMVVANDYYVQKSSGLAELYPGLLRVVRGNEPDQGERLRRAIEEAWRTPASARAEGRQASERYHRLAEDAFEVFAGKVDAHMARPHTAVAGGARTAG